jgi:hypothetical protein
LGGKQLQLSAVVFWTRTLLIEVSKLTGTFANGTFRTKTEGPQLPSERTIIPPSLGAAFDPERTIALHPLQVTSRHPRCPAIEWSLPDPPHGMMSERCCDVASVERLGGRPTQSQMGWAAGGGDSFAGTVWQLGH